MLHVGEELGWQSDSDSDSESSQSQACFVFLSMIPVCISKQKKHLGVKNVEQRWKHETKERKGTKHKFQTFHETHSPAPGCLRRARQMGHMVTPCHTVVAVFFEHVKTSSQGAQGERLERLERLEQVARLGGGGIWKQAFHDMYGKMKMTKSSSDCCKQSNGMLLHMPRPLNVRSLGKCCYFF